MKCHLCGIKWEDADNRRSYCPQCGAPSGTDRRISRTWRGTLLIGSIAAGTWLFAALGPLSCSRRLNAAERAEMTQIDTEIAQVEAQIRQCPEQQKGLLRDIVEEG